MHTSIRQVLISVMVGGVLFIGVASLLVVWIYTNDLVNRQLQRTFQSSKTQLQTIVEQSAETLHQQLIELSQRPAFQSSLIVKDLKGLEDAARRYTKSKKASFIVTKVGLDKPLVYGLENARDHISLSVSIKINENITLTAREKIKSTHFDSLAKQHNIGVVIQQAADSSPVFLSDYLSGISIISMSDFKSSPQWLNSFLAGEKVFVARRLNSFSVAHPSLEIFLVAELTEYYRAISQLQLVLLGIIVLASILSLVIAIRISRRIKKPIDQLIIQADNIAKGDFSDTNYASNSLTEVNNLINSFSSMRKSVKHREEEVHFQSGHDLVSGLYNRTFLEHMVSKAIADCQHLQLVAIKIVGFRTINDLYGYVNGDKCLIVLAQRLLRWPGIAARISDGEIVYIPEKPLSEEQLETLRHILEQAVEIDYLSIPIKVVLVEINCPEQVESVADMFRKINITIDEAMSTKQSVLAFDDQLDARYARQLKIVLELKKALVSSQSELSMVYQPKICLKTNKLSSVEALIRWNSKALGIVPADEFIRVAEQAGIVDKITDWVIQRVLSELLEFRQHGYLFPVAINFSSQDIQRESFIDSFADLVKTFGLTPNDIEIEITESDIMADYELAKRNLKVLHGNGFNLALDDFGTGYSSLAYIKAFTVSTLKIDKSFILQLNENESDKQIVRTILLLANALDFSVTAEGVENKESLALLQEWGCHHAQGFYLCKPLSAKELIEFCTD